jgi:hypothetical protein
MVECRKVGLCESYLILVSRVLFVGDLKDHGTGAAL